MLPAQTLAAGANRKPKRAVLFYATAAKTDEQLIGAAGYEPAKVGGVADVGRMEAPGCDLQFNGELIDLDRARAALN